jgi:hypothetical protein
LEDKEMPRKPVLTDDTHLHEETPEHVYRLHHGRDPQTGEALRGVTEVAEDECGCAHCVAHVEGDETVLTEARTAFADGVKQGKTSKRRK